MSIHTSIPLSAKRTDAHHAVIYDISGMIVASLAGNERAWERAQHIVKCVNAHDELVTALRCLTGCLCNDAGYASELRTALKLLAKVKP